MAKMIYQAIMHPGDEYPKEDGDYYVMSIDREDGTRTLNTYEFNVGYGWNSHKYADGTVRNNHSFELTGHPYQDYYWLEKGAIYEEHN